MATAVIDVDYLSGYLSIPQQTLSTVIDTPTAELVQAVLRAVTAKAHEHDELIADKLRVEIELENVVRSSETRIEGLRSQVEKAQNTVEEVRTKLKEEGELNYNIMRIRQLITTYCREQTIKSRDRTPNPQIFLHHINLRSGNPSHTHFLS